MPKITLTRDEAIEDWGLLDDGNEEMDIEIIDNEIYDHGRWTVSHALTIRRRNQYYQTSYRVGATESQDERPWEYDKEVILVEVKPVQKTVTVYEEIKDA